MKGFNLLLCSTLTSLIMVSGCTSKNSATGKAEVEK